MDKLFRFLVLVCEVTSASALVSLPMVKSLDLGCQHSLVGSDRATHLRWTPVGTCNTSTTLSESSNWQWNTACSPSPSRLTGWWGLGLARSLQAPPLRSYVQLCTDYSVHNNLHCGTWSMICWGHCQDFHAWLCLRRGSYPDINHNDCCYLSCKPQWNTV